MKIMVIKNKNSLIKYTYQKTLKEIGKEIGIEIIEKENYEVWKEIKENKIDKEIKKIWMLKKDYQLAKYLEIRGYEVYNNSKAIEICDNKGNQYIYLEKYMPKTQLCPLVYNYEDITIDMFNNITYPCILKEYYNSIGKGVYKIQNEKELKEAINKIKTHLFLIQEYIETGDVEYKSISYRTLVIGNKVVATMKNCNKHDYKTQTIYGGEHYKYELPQKAEQMVLEAIKIIGNDIAGVDLFQDKNTGKWYISEVNCSSGLEILSKIYARELSKDILEYIVGD